MFRALSDQIEPSEQNVSYPPDKAAERLMREAQEAQRIRDLAEGGVVGRMVREAQEREQRIRDAAEGGVVGRMVREAQEREQRIRDAADGGVVGRMVREAQEREQRIRDAADGGVVGRMVREAQEREQRLRHLAEGGAVGHHLNGDQWRAADAGMVFDPDEVGLMRRSESLRQASEDASRDKAIVESQLDQIDPEAEGTERASLEAIRDVLSEQARSSKRASRLERLRERKSAADYWFRQWTNSLSIGNGAGFLAVTTSMLGATNFERSVTLSALPMTFFGLGLSLAGGLRLAVWTHHTIRRAIWQRASRVAVTWGAALSAVAFLLGVGTAIATAWQSQQTARLMAERRAALESQELKVREVDASRRLAAARSAAKVTTQVSATAAPAK